MLRTNFLLFCSLALQRFVACQEFTITRQSDVAAIVSKGSTVTGNLVIATNAAGSINLDGIKEIRGNLSCENSQIKSLSSQSVNLITDYMFLLNLTYLTSLEMPVLRKLGGIMWWALPSLDEPDFEWGLDVVPYIHIENTLLSSIGNINTISVSSLAVLKNYRLRTLRLDLETIQGNLMIKDNKSLKVVDLGRAKKATTIQLEGNFTDIRGLDTIKQLNQIELNITAPWDCTQYRTSFEGGTVMCTAANSTLSRFGKGENSTTDGTVITSLPLPLPTTLVPNISDTDQTQVPVPLDPASRSPASKRLPNYGIALIALGSVSILSGILICLLRLRKAKKRASKDAGAVELPLGGHNEKVELAVEERPVELEVGMIREHESPPKTIEKPVFIPQSSRIIDVKDLTEYSHDGAIFGDGKVAMESLESNESPSKGVILKSDLVEIPSQDSSRNDNGQNLEGK